MIGRRVVAVLVTGALALGACGDDEPISDGAAVELRSKADALRASANARDADAVQARLADLRQSVARLREEGEITQDAADRVLRAAQDVEDTIGAITTTTTTTTTAPPPPPRAEEDDDHDDEDGKGKGRRKDDD